MNDVTGIIYKVPEDQWYKYKGVKPPVRTPHGLSEDNVEEWINKNNAHAHIWRQKGNYIFCNQGHNEHGKNVGVNVRLDRKKPTNDDGSPNLVKI